MPLALLTTTAFERDLTRVRKQGKDLDKLEEIVDLLQEESPFRFAAGLTCYAETGPDIGIATSPRTGFLCTASGPRN
jgi:hypothetical protein